MNQIADTIDGIASVARLLQKRIDQALAHEFEAPDLDHLALADDELRQWLIELRDQAEEISRKIGRL